MKTNQRRQYNPAAILRRLYQKSSDDSFCFEGGDTPQDDQSSESGGFIRQTAMNENEWQQELQDTLGGSNDVDVAKKENFQADEIVTRIEQSQTQSKSQSSPSQKKSWIDGLVISILGITAMANSAYAIIAPFLPFEFERKGVDQDWIGYIFAIYSVAVIFCSPLVGNMITVFGRRNLIVSGMFLMGASFIVFGLISDMEDKHTFITLSLINRFLQGFSSSMIQTTMYSISTNFYPDNKDAMVGYIEAVTGVGLILGPLIGSFLYAVGGYKFIFLSFGSLFILSSFFIKNIFGENIDRVSGNQNSEQRSTKEVIANVRTSNNFNDDFQNADDLLDNEQDGQKDVDSLIDDQFFGVDDEQSHQDNNGVAAAKSESPNEIEKSPKDQNSNYEGKQINGQSRIGTFELLRHPKFFFAASSGALGYFLYGFMEPILAFRVKEFHLNQVQIGFFFMIMPCFYIPTSVLVQQVPNGIEKRAILIIAAFISFFANLAVGPSQIFDFPDTVWMMAIGQIFHGILDPFILVPSLPEMIESVLPLYDESAESQINDLSSGIFNMFLGIGQVSGPLFGSQMTKLVGFRLTCDIVAIICLVFSILYYLVADGQEALNRSRWVNILPEDEHMILNKSIVPMGGVMTPLSNCNSIKNRSKLLKSHNSFKQYTLTQNIITKKEQRIEQEIDDDFFLDQGSNNQDPLKSENSYFSHLKKDVKASDLQTKLQQIQDNQSPRIGE